MSPVVNVTAIGMRIAVVNVRLEAPGWQLMAATEDVDAELRRRAQLARNALGECRFVEVAGSTLRAPMHRVRVGGQARAAPF